VAAGEKKSGTAGEGAI